MQLDFTALEKAVTAFEQALQVATDESLMQKLTDIQQSTLRAGVIQHFEFTYELAWKMLKRQLIEDEGKEAINPLDRKDLFRLGGKKALLENVEVWFEFHYARNLTSHTYNEAKAEEVFAVCQQFLPHVKSLLQNLLRLNNN